MQPFGCSSSRASSSSRTIELIVPMPNTSSYQWKTSRRPPPSPVGKLVRFVGTVGDGGLVGACDFPATSVGFPLELAEPSALRARSFARFSLSFPAYRYQLCSWNPQSVRSIKPTDSSAARNSLAFRVGQPAASANSSGRISPRQPSSSALSSAHHQRACMWPIIWYLVILRIALARRVFLCVSRDWCDSIQATARGHPARRGPG